MLLLKVLQASWRQQWQQLLLVIFGLLCASGGLSSVLALNETAKQKMSQLNTPFIGKPQAIATLGPDKVFNKKDYAEILNQGWRVVGLYRFKLKVATKETGDKPIAMVAMDVANLMTQIQIARIQSEHKTKSQHSASKNAAMLSSGSGEQTGLSNWQSPLVSIDTQNWFKQHVDPKSWPLRSPVAVPQIKDENIYISMSNAGSLQPSININELWIFGPIDKKQAKYLSRAGFELQIISSDTGTLTDSFYVNITAMGLLMFAVSMFISLNAYNLLFSGRKSLIRQLYLMGVDIRHMITMFAIESNFFTLMFCTLGYLLGLGLAQLISPSMEMTLRNLYDASFTDTDIGFFKVWLYVVIAGLLAANLILWFPLNRSLEQLNKSDQKREKSNSPRFFRLSGIVKQNSLSISIAILFAMIVWLSVFPDTGLLLSFLLITGCVLCGCVIILLLIPRVLDLVKQHASPEHPLLFYYCADAVRLSDKSRIAICAFFIAITANIGMNMMVGSFRQATDTWIHQQFVADFYLSTNDAVEFQQWASRQHNLNVYHRTRSEIVYQGRKTEVLPKPVNAQGHLPLFFKSRLINNRLSDNVSTENNVYINEQMSIRHKLQTGERLNINNQNYLVAGIYYDYGNMFNQILIEKEIVQQFYLDDSKRQLFSLTLKSEIKDPAQYKKSLISQLEQLDVSYFSGAQIKDISMKVFEQTFVITSGLNLITLLVAGLSLATSILIIEGQNNQQTRILHQLGISDVRIWYGSLMQYGYLISIVFILSVPFGILLSYQLINNINYSAFQWSYPLQHDLISYGFVYGIALLTVIFTVSLLAILKKLQTFRKFKSRNKPDATLVNESRDLNHE